MNITNYYLVDINRTTRLILRFARRVQNTIAVVVVVAVVVVFGRKSRHGFHSWTQIIYLYPQWYVVNWVPLSAEGATVYLLGRR